MINHRFNVGDRVVVVQEEADYQTLNMTGTVVAVKYGADMVGVKHDQRFTSGHDLDGILVGEDAQKGLWYCDPNNQLKRLHHEFVRGDRVMIVSHPNSDLIGSYGTVVYAAITNGGQVILVNHDMEHPVLHDGKSWIKDEHTPPHHGWWYFDDHSLRYVPRMMLMPDDDSMNDVL